MILPATLGICGACLIVFAIWRLKRAENRSVFTPQGLTLLAGIALVTAALIIGPIQADHREQRAKFDASLVKMFGRAPDRLELQGDSLATFKGVAYYDGKAFQIKTEPITFNDKMAQYQITATPIGQ